MCQAPNKLPDNTLVACRNCELCRKRAINDWVGRNIAESKTAVAANVITLTYGHGRAGDADHERATLLTYSDVQKWLKLLRRHGYPVRYFIAGEYGSDKGRAHWHAIVYWLKKAPPHEIGKHWHDEFWFNYELGKPHGHQMWDRLTPQSIRYAAKYVQKDHKQTGQQGKLVMSKKPPIGALYFQQLAERYVEQGLAPQSLLYSFPDVRGRRKDGTPYVVPFFLKSRSAELFLDHFVATWREKRPDRRMPESELVDEYLGKLARPEIDAYLWEYRERMVREKQEKAREKTPLEEWFQSRNPGNKIPRDLHEWDVAYEAETAIREGLK